jgi:diaminohydroxyphosphoribosylaminopyrimidine deaminase/5-amino-6-(5-phosphoribosylamino)uracil reductase
MRHAIALAEKGRGETSPNPVVGAVVVRDGRAAGEGFHRGPGTPHAEVVALRSAGDLARGATLYTTLEPCTHYGRTPPCTTAIAEAGIARVVAALRDPHDIVDGRGFARLRESGIEVVEDVEGDDVARRLAPYTKHVRTGRPFVVLKMASSLDGKVAARDGTSRWVTGPEARADAHRLRAESDAILVGSGTVLADDPSLTVRHGNRSEPPPLRVVVDSRGRIEPSRRVLDAEAPTLVVTTDRSSPERRESWRSAGAEVTALPPDGAGVSLHALAAELGKRNVQQLLVEGGPTVAWGFVEADLVDRVVLYLAPTLLGGKEAPGVLGGRGFAPLGRALRLAVVAVDTVGSDIRVEADVHRDR